MPTFSTKPWKAPSVADFGGDVGRYCAACMIDTNPAGSEKTAGNCKLPYKEPGGAVNVAALRAVLSVLGGGRGGVQASSAQKAAAKAKAQRLLSQAGGSPANGRSAQLVEEFRARPVGYELRDGDQVGGSRMPTLVGHLAVFNEWAEVRSRNEGHFMERLSPRAFTKTIKENLTQMRCLFQHGQDPQFGEKPLGPIKSVRSTDVGVEYEVPLLDTSYNRDLITMLRSDPPVLGSSFRFAVIDDDVDARPRRSAHNPKGIPERTIRELRMSEFGPVTFPAYKGTTSSLRSITDWLAEDRVGAAVDWLEEERVDTEDLDCLAQMIHLGACYIDEQDEPGDEVNIPKMESVLATLVELASYESTEDEPADEPEDEEPSDDEMASDAPAEDEGASSGDRTSTTVAEPPMVAHRASGRRERPPLYPSRKGAESWRLP